MMFFSITPQEKILVYKELIAEAEEKLKTADPEKAEDLKWRINSLKKDKEELEKLLGNNRMRDKRTQGFDFPIPSSTNNSPRTRRLNKKYYEYEDF